MKKSDIAMVVPTIREKNFIDFVERWDALKLWDRVDLIVMEDNPEQAFSLHEKTRVHLTWESIRESLGCHEWIIPRRSDTVRSYAYLYAWRSGYEYIMTLDDDCYPPTQADGVRYESGAQFVDEHLKYLTKRTRWYSTLDLARPRGIPYKNLGQRNDIVLNHGLWTNVLDYDACTQLANPQAEKFSFDNKVVPHGCFFPMCGMNLAWRADITVLMYHLLMGRMINGGELIPLPFDRFGDIWCGIIAKKVCDIHGLSVSTGMPYIRHERASDPFVNLRKEANGVQVNERFWEHVDAFRPSSLSLGKLADTYGEMGAHVGHFDAFPEHSWYFSRLGDAMQHWAELFGTSIPR